MAKTKKEPGSTEVTITSVHGTFPGSPPLTQMCNRQLRLNGEKDTFRLLAPKVMLTLSTGSRKASQSLWQDLLSCLAKARHIDVWGPPLLAPSLPPEAIGRPGPITVKPLRVSPCTLVDIWLPLPGNMKAPIFFGLNLDFKPGWTQG